MEKHIQLLFYRINNLEFKFNGNVKEGMKFNIVPKIECKAGRNGKSLLVNLSARINEDISSPVPFNLSVEMFANFTVKEEAEQSVFAAEAMETLYPFLRASVASITANCNIIPYVLPVISYNAENGQNKTKNNENLN